MNPLIDNLLHAATILALWKTIKAINRFESVTRDYPPHKHINGSIVYPNDFQPGKVEHMGAAAGR